VTWPEDKLIAGLKARDPEAVQALVERFQSPLFGLAKRITKSAEDAEEVLQDVFVTVYNKVDTFEGKSAFSSWVHRIAINASYMKIRGERRKRELLAEDFEPNFLTDGHLAVADDWSADLERRIADRDIADKIHAFAEELGDEYRDVFIMRDVNGLTNQEVAEALDISVAAVKSRLHRARLFLRKRLAAVLEQP